MGTRRQFSREFKVEAVKLEIKWGEPAVSWRRVLRRENNYPVALSKAPPVPFKALSSVSLIMAELRLGMQDVA
ncbi:hypothetical protein [Comamonas thiooxydans]|uniref:hypothetical protein n=1 Tax=Comamonas thiooxydans TaxID=363952 RepID=UPI001556F94C|nr:hypothetical protein [Comamonas thiooxydans]BDB67954.1 hypothetical protein Cthiooxydans_03660 [Comamonas thiooxydans]